MMQREIGLSETLAAARIIAPTIRSLDLFLKNCLSYEIIVEIAREELNKPEWAALERLSLSKHEIIFSSSCSTLLT